MWSNRETKVLFEHLTIPAAEFVFAKELVDRALDDVNSKPEIWHDYERQVLRVIATTLRAHVEGVSEDFYFASNGSPHSRVIALMCSDVGSLWRVNWQELAKELAVYFEKYPLDPPDDLP